MNLASTTSYSKHHGLPNYQPSPPSIEAGRGPLFSAAAASPEDEPRGATILVAGPAAAAALLDYSAAISAAASTTAPPGPTAETTRSQQIHGSLAGTYTTQGLL